MTFVPAVFPKIPAYRREADAIHLARSVVCLEKIDGTNTRVGVARNAKSPDEVVFGGRSLVEGEEGFCQPVLRASFGALDALLRVCATLDDDVTLYGETCGRGIQAQGFIYGARAHFVLFGARVGGAWLSYSHATEVWSDDDTPKRLPSLVELAGAAGLDLAPRLAQGSLTPEDFDALLDRPSAHGLDRARGAAQEATHEGVVIWSDPLLLDGAGRPLVAKHKHPNRREADDEAPGGDEGVDDFARRVVGVERVLHAAQHLRDAGRLACGHDERVERVVRRVIQDVAREEASYAAQLARWGKGAVRAALEGRARAVIASDPSTLADAP